MGRGVWKTKLSLVVVGLMAAMNVVGVGYMVFVSVAVTAELMILVTIEFCIWDSV